MTYSVGDRVYWDNGARHIPGTVKAINVRNVDVNGQVHRDFIWMEIDAQSRFEPATGSILPLRVKLPAWSARLHPLSAKRHIG